jgi:hypothetical protein
MTRILALETAKALVKDGISQKLPLEEQEEDRSKRIKKKRSKGKRRSFHLT